MMKKFAFVLSYFLIPAVPLCFYLGATGYGFDAYTASVFLGVYAFMLVCGQFLLATRPRIAVEALGLKGLLAFHGGVPALILLFAAAHKLLKEASGFGDETLQARFGAVSFLIFAVAAVFSVLFMANTFWLKIGLVKNLKEWVYKTTGLTYKTARSLHNVTVAAGATILVHVFLASSSAFASNPAGIAIMASWMLFSLGMYFRYRLKGRTVKGK